MESPAERGALTGVFALVIDADTAGGTGSVSAVLREAGALVRAVSDPGDIADVVEHVHPDIVVIDAQGLAITEPLFMTELRRRRVGTDIPAIAIALPAQLDTLHAAGVQVVLTPPVAPATLEDAVRVGVGAGRASVPHRPRVLIADDHDDGREFLATTLRAYDVLLAANGEEAIEMYRRARPDVVILDVLMPVRDGIETIIALRREDPAARIIAISAGWSSGRASASVAPDLLAEARHFGADVTLRKPVSPSLIVHAVRELLGPSASA